MPTIKFSQHAIKRALERRLWKYVNKEVFYYEAEHLAPGRAIIDHVIYAFVQTKTSIVIKTIYKELY